MSARWPWNVVRGFKVVSQADGVLRIEPDYINPWKGPEEGGGPGLFTRMALARWCEERLAKRGTRAPATSSVMDKSAGVDNQDGQPTVRP